MGRIRPVALNSEFALAVLLERLSPFFFWFKCKPFVVIIAFLLGDVVVEICKIDEFLTYRGRVWLSARCLLYLIDFGCGFLLCGMVVEFCKIEWWLRSLSHFLFG